MGLGSRSFTSKRLVIPADKKFLPKVRDFAVKYGKKQGFNRKEMNELKVSIDEICANIVLYAYKGMERGSIQIEIQRKDDLVIVNIIDTGVEFDYSTVQEPDLDIYVREGRKGGLGIHLVKKLNDEVRYKREGNRNIFTFLKSIEPRSPLIRRIKNNFQPTK